MLLNDWNHVLSPASLEECLRICVQNGLWEEEASWKHAYMQGEARALAGEGSWGDAKGRGWGCRDLSQQKKMYWQKQWGSLRSFPGYRISPEFHWHTGVIKGRLGEHVYRQGSPAQTLDFYKYRWKGTRVGAQIHTSLSLATVQSES